MMYVIYTEDTKEVLAIIDTDKNKSSACINGIAFKRFDDDCDPIFLQASDGNIYLKEDAFLFYPDGVRKWK